ncbi:heme ABC transporter ATP-binding protein [Microvirga makkahensis]|uniref:Heme ABC transporter ATP-binding protein n=1 Tax=Microvirga makkahensis TaxID=1128670 RepID=A0A7X3MUA9_9HYPH|nr:heme ABC transporter ATP-binding protein [Microvirga makkahensis]MXQ13377.1 heme ABC transporter ATP-binding protein [Microvirga makkahensis]
MTALLEAEAISYRSGGRILVDNVDLSFASGSFNIVIGPNGAGKSTLLRILCGELHPTTGSIRWNGEPLHSIPAWRLAHRRAMMPQASDLNFPFTVFEVASLGVEGTGRGLTREDRQRLALDALEEADVAHLALRNYQSLSGGERQRVHFARVLAQLKAGQSLERQQVLFLDEPIASLDLKHQLSLLQISRRLAQDGLTVVAVLHDLQLACGTADELIVMQAGRLVARGKPDAALTPQRMAEVFGVEFVAPGPASSPWRLVLEGSRRPAPASPTAGSGLADR